MERVKAKIFFFFFKLTVERCLLSLQWEVCSKVARASANFQIYFIKKYMTPRKRSLRLSIFLIVVLAHVLMTC